MQNKVNWVGVLSRMAMALIGAVCGYLIAINRPIYRFSDGNLDSHWQAALEAASKTPGAFNDYVFTFGPLINFYYVWPSDGTVLLGVLVVGLALLFASARNMLVPLVAGAAFLISGAVYPAIFSNDFVIVLLCVLGLVYSREPVIAPLLLAAICYTKYSLTALVILLVVFCGVYALFKRDKRMLAAVGVFIAAGVALFQMLYGLQHLPRFVYFHKDIISGYSSAMVLDNNTAFPAFVAFLLIALSWALLARRGIEKIGLTALCAAFTAFIVFKAGYVRADNHIWRFWEFASYLAVFSFALAVVRTILQARAGRSALLSGFPLAAAVSAGVVVFCAVMGASFSTPFAKGTYTYTSWHNTLAAADQANAPLKTYLETASDRASAPTHDGFPVQISFLFKRGLEYLPRPVLQEYSAYTSKLRQLNADHYRTTGPDFLHVFSLTGDIDGRLPGSSSGPTLFSILDSYAFSCKQHDIPGSFTGTRRGKIQSEFLPLAPTGNFQIGEWVAVPSPGTNELATFSMKLHKTLGGRIWSAVYKPLPLSITLRTKSGLERTYRLIDADLSLPSLLSAYQLDPKVLKLASLDPVVALRVNPPEHHSWMYGRKASLRLGTYPLSRADIRDCPWNDAASVSGGFAATNDLFAGAPSTIVLKPTAKHRLRVHGFMDPKTWSCEQADGVSFTVEINGEIAANQSITSQESGALDFSAMVGPEDTVTLKTHQIQRYGCDWAYWSLEYQ